MKAKFHYFIALVLLALSTFDSQFSIANAQGTAFTYQGRLNNNGSPASGLYDFQFSLSNAPSGGSQVGGTVTNLAVDVINGLFTTTVDFGAVFTGNPTWLAISVRTNGVGGYAGLTPLQPITPTPYAIFANTASNVSGTVSAGQLSGMLPLAQLPGAVVTNNANSVNLSGTFTGNGSGLPNLNVTALNLTNVWQTTGNSVTPGQFLGSTNNQPVEIWANGRRALRLEPGGASASLGNGIPTGAPNVIGGSPANFVASGVVGAVIGGGGATNYEGLSYTNSIGTYSDFSIISGGVGNTIQSNSYSSTIGGGAVNTIESYNSFVGDG